MPAADAAATGACFSQGPGHKTQAVAKVVQSDQRSSHAQDLPRRTCHDSTRRSGYFAACNSEWSQKTSSTLTSPPFANHILPILASRLSDFCITSVTVTALRNKQRIQATSILSSLASCSSGTCKGQSESGSTLAATQATLLHIPSSTDEIQMVPSAIKLKGTFFASQLLTQTKTTAPFSYTVEEIQKGIVALKGVALKDPTVLRHCGATSKTALSAEKLPPHP